MSSACFVVVVHFGAAALTRSCLEGLAAAGAHPVIAVDNGGPDRPPGGLAAALGTIPGVEVVVAPSNLGFGGGVNLGVRSGPAAPYVLVINPDARLRPGGLEALISVLDRRPEVALVCPVEVGSYSDDPGSWYRGGEFDWRKAASRYGVPGEAEELLVADGEVLTDFACGTCFLARREVFDDLGGFEEEYFLYAEDEELSLRLRAQGWELAVTAAAVSEHAGQGSQVDGGVQAPLLSPKNPRLESNAFYLARNRLRNAWTYARGADRLRFLGGYPLYMMGKWAQFLGHGRGDGVRGWARGVWAFMRGDWAGPMSEVR